MSREKPANTHAKSKDELSKFYVKVGQRVGALSAELADAMYVETIDEARFLFDLMRNDAHVLNLRDKRNELEFLLRRQKDLKTDLDNFSAPEVAA